MFYQVPLDEELAQVKRAIAYYAEWAEELRSGEHCEERVLKYYRGLLDPSKVAAFRFRALFFAMRLQPVLTYISEFAQQYGDAPQVLDLGCGYGIETLLLALSGAKAHGIDLQTAKITFARERQARYQQAHNKRLDLQFDTVSLFEHRPDELYDAVYSTATLHHIEPTPDAFEFIAQLIKPGGHFFLGEENGYSPIQQITVQKRIGWTHPRKVWVVKPESGERYLYGNENIRPAYQWARHMRAAGLLPQSIKYCRVLPPLDWPIERLVRSERRLRSIPVLAQVSAIGFLLTAHRPPT